MLKHTPFHPRLAELSQTQAWGNWAGYLSAMRYDLSSKHEYFAVRNAAGFFDTYDRDEDSGMQIWLDAWAEASRRPALQRISRAINGEWQRTLADIIDAGVGDGSMRCDDPDASAWRILSLLDGLKLQVVAHGDVLSLGQADAWSRAAAERELGLEFGELRVSADRSDQVRAKVVRSPS